MSVNINVDAKMAEINENADDSLTIESKLDMPKSKLDSFSKPTTNNNSVEKLEKLNIKVENKKSNQK